MKDTTYNMSQSGKTLRWQVKRAVSAFVKIWKGCEEGMSGKKSSELRTMRRGLLVGSWVWKRIWGVWDMPKPGQIQSVGNLGEVIQEMALMEK